MTATYVAAGSIDEVLSALASGARPIAGGTDLVVGHRSGKAPLPEKLVAIHELDELRSITESAGAVSLGALVNHERITPAPGDPLPITPPWRMHRPSSAPTRRATPARSAATS